MCDALTPRGFLLRVRSEGFIGNAHPPSSTPMSIYIPNLEHLHLSLLGCPSRWTVYGPSTWRWKLLFCVDLAVDVLNLLEPAELLSCTLREHSANQHSIATIVNNAPELKTLHIRGTAGAVADVSAIDAGQADHWRTFDVCCVVRAACCCADAFGPSGT